MAEPAAVLPVTLEEKKAAARERARTARAAQAAGLDAGLVSISDAAAAYIRESAARSGMQPGVRLRILAGGCSGLEYKLDLLAVDDAPNPDEREVTSNDVRILMDLKSAIHVTGSVIDYESGLLRRGFRINNPNATGTCSCGDSFSA
jgi:iron-sulfur cluster assembly accessory protein